MAKLKNTIQLKGVRYPRNAHPTKVWLDGHYLKADKSLKIRHHSTARFGWGNDEKEGIQLALAICLELYPEEIATKVYLSFREQFISPINEESFIMDLNLEEFHETYVPQLLEMA